MKPERIRPAWRCPDHDKHHGVYTEPGECSKCGKRLKKFTPISDLPTIFRCKSCRGVFTEEPPKKQGHVWTCPECGTPTIAAYGCEESYLEKQRAKRKPPPEPKKKVARYQFGRTVKKTFEVTNAVSRAAFKAQQLAERLSQRNPQDSDSKGYIDAVEFDISRFNMRAQMVVDMVVVKSLLEEANLTEYVPGALERILDSRLGLRVQRQQKGDGTPATPKR